MRIRSLRPAAFSSETLALVPIEVRWTFAGLWCYVDDEGRGRADPRLIKAAIYPLDDDMTPEIVEEHIAALEAVGVVCRYEAGGRRLLHSVNAVEHQRPNRPSPSTLPPCGKPVHGGLSERSVSAHGGLTPVVVVVEEGSSRGGVEEEVLPPRQAADGGARTPAASPVDDEPRQTVGQRAKALTDAYAEAEPMCKWPAVRAIVAKALRTGRWPDDAIRDALLRLAKDGRPVTVDTLRVELDGLPPPNGQHRPATTDLRVGAGEALARRYEAFDAPPRELPP